MKNMKGLLVVLLAVIATAWTVVTPTRARAADPQAQGSTALERGYRTGYSDGYQSGFKDQSDHSPRDFADKEDYQHADRAYVEAWGPVEDYRDGYQQGYELGYGAGFERQQFNSALPTGFKKRGSQSSNDNQSSNNNNVPSNSVPSNNQGNNQSNSQSSSQNNPPDSNQNTASNAPASMSGTLSIPRDTVLLVELESSLSTDDSQRGDRFQARVVEPREYAGATIEGRVSRVQKGGKVKSNAELQLSFDQIRLPDNRSANMHAEVIEVVASGGSSGVGDVDSEGGVRGKSTTKDDITKVGAATGIGAIIGAIAGGGKGAAIGAAIGGGVGTAGVITTRGKDIRLAKGQQLRIRTSTDTGIQ